MSAMRNFYTSLILPIQLCDMKIAVKNFYVAKFFVLMFVVFL